MTTIAPSLVLTLKHVAALTALTRREAAELTDLPELLHLGLVRVIQTDIGPLVTPTRRARTVLGSAAGPVYALTRVADLVYMRLAVRHFGWRITRVGKHPYRMANLKDMTWVQTWAKPQPIAGSVTGGGYKSKSVRRALTLKTGSLLHDATELIVVHPVPRRLTLLGTEKHLTLQVVIFKPELARDM